MQHHTGSSIWLRFSAPKPHARLRLFCFPYAGGGASAFRSIFDRVPEEIEVCPVQLPGRENRFSERPFLSLAPLVAALHEEILPYLDMPYAFFGHSMGALISFELACALRRSGQVPGPAHLLLSGHRAPHLADQRSPAHQLPTPQFLDALRSLQGTPEKVLQHQELLQLLLPLLRADFAVCETYTYAPQAPLACPISAFGGLQDPNVPCEAIRAWKEHTTHTCRVHFFAGGHFFWQDEPASLFAALWRDLAGSC